jgi:hypothetical protein
MREKEKNRNNHELQLMRYKKILFSPYSGLLRARYKMVAKQIRISSPLWTGGEYYNALAHF